MRVINFHGEEPDQAWLDKAKDLTNQLNAAKTKGDRDEIIDDNSKFWGELKPWLLRFSEQKCWFSEARGCFSHWDVEHYRPKKAARNLDGSERPDGYWWLAFDWHNLMICGNVGNRKKGTFFPLRDGTHVATSKDRNTDDEFPYLLDPTRADDVVLLTFDQSGDIKPLPDLDSWSTRRVEESIKRYKLREHESLMEARRDVWSRCSREVNHCQILMAEVNKRPTATNKEKISQQMDKLREMLMFKAEFSSVAIECLRSRPERWAQRLASEGQS